MIRLQQETDGCPPGRQASTSTTSETGHQPRYGKGIRREPAWACALAKPERHGLPPRCSVLSSCRRRLREGRIRGRDSDVAGPQRQTAGMTPDWTCRKGPPPRGGRLPRCACVTRRHACSLALWRANRGRGRRGRGRVRSQRPSSSPERKEGSSLHPPREPPAPAEPPPRRRSAPPSIRSGRRASSTAERCAGRSTGPEQRWQRIEGPKKTHRRRACQLGAEVARTVHVLHDMTPCLEIHSSSRRSYCSLHLLFSSSSVAVLICCCVVLGEAPHPRGGCRCHAPCTATTAARSRLDSGLSFETVTALQKHRPSEENQCDAALASPPSLGSDGRVRAHVSCLISSFTHCDMRRSTLAILPRRILLASFWPRTDHFTAAHLACIPVFHGRPRPCSSSRAAQQSVSPAPPNDHRSRESTTRASKSLRSTSIRNLVRLDGRPSDAHPLIPHRPPRLEALIAARTPAKARRACCLPVAASASCRVLYGGRPLAGVEQPH